MFEADLDAGELRKHGTKIALQEKPFQVLAALVERPGEVVSREELRQRLWPTDTFVDFEHSLNIAMTKLREALGDSTDNPQFIETLPRRGYRLIAPVAGTQLRTRASASPYHVAVLPFANLGGSPETEYLSDGITESLIYNLSQLPNLRLISRTSVFRYKGRDIDPQQVGRELDVGSIVAGRVTSRGEFVTVSAELVDARDNSHIWGQCYHQKLSDLLAAQEQIARVISEKLRLKLNHNQKKRLARRPTLNSEAYQLYLKGRYFWNKRTDDGLTKALEHFERAIACDPAYAQAYAGLADCYAMLAWNSVFPPRESLPKAKAAAMRATEIDDQLAEGHAALALTKLVYDLDWANAERGFQRAIELSPSYAVARHWYTLELTSLGRHEEANREAEEALNLDPLSLPINANLAFAFYFARQYDRAIEQCQKTLEMDANYFPALYALGYAYEQKAMHTEAVAELQKAVALSAGNPLALAPLAYAHAMAGNLEKAQELLRQSQEIARQKYFPAHSMAIMHLALGHKEAALEWLGKAREEHSFRMITVKVDPIFNSLHGEARFQTLLGRMGLTA